MSKFGLYLHRIYMSFIQFLLSASCMGSHYLVGAIIFTSIGVARCKKCDGDINYNQEVYKLYRHLANRHPSVYKELYNGGDATTAAILKASKGKQHKRKKATDDKDDNDSVPLKKITNHPCEGDNNEMTQEEKREEEKHWLEMWEDARCKIKQIRQDIKIESDDEMIEDMKTDMKGLKKRKAHFAQLLGM